MSPPTQIASRYELGRRLGRAMREFRRASDEFRSTVEQNLQIHENPDISPPSPSPYDPVATSATDGASPSTDTAAATGQGTNGHGEPAVAGATEDGQGIEEPLEPFWTSRGGRLLHRRECAWRARVPASDRIPLKTALDGWEQGLKPCPACAPQVAEVTS